MASTNQSKNLWYLVGAVVVAAVVAYTYFSSDAPTPAGDVSVETAPVVEAPAVEAPAADAPAAEPVTVEPVTEDAADDAGDAADDATDADEADDEADAPAVEVEPAADAETTGN